MQIIPGNFYKPGFRRVQPFVSIFMIMDLIQGFTIPLIAWGLNIPIKVKKKSCFCYDMSALYLSNPLLSYVHENVIYRQIVWL